MCFPYFTLATFLAPIFFRAFFEFFRDDLDRVIKRLFIFLLFDQI